MMTEQQREELIAAVESANLCCPEQVCDAVLAAAESEGIEAGRAELAKAIANDESESRALGLTVCDRTVRVDHSGQGHNWRPASSDDLPAGITEEIECEILDGGNESCDDYIASNGLHYRW